MAKFLTFETTAIRLNDSIFPSNSASFGLQANTVPVFDINGNLIDYAPNGPIQGKFSTEFYLTGALPDFLKLENQSDVPISVSFNNFNIPSAFLTDLSFSVEPYQPIAVSTSFDFYHGIRALDTNLNDIHTLFGPADGSTKVKNKLATLNGLSSYIVTYNRSSYADNSTDFIVSNFNYSFTVERQPLLRVKQSIPLRVALRQINAQFGVTANNIDGLLDVHGNDAVFNAVLKDAQNPSVYTNMSLTGIIVDQNYAISDSSYGVGSIKMIQNISKKRNIISIPFGTNDPQIVETAPPVLGIWTPTTTTQTIVNRGPLIPPPPAISFIPPTPQPPTLDPNLIWFNVYAQMYDINSSNNACSNAQYQIFGIKAASPFDNNEYKIDVRNVQSLIKVDTSAKIGNANSDYFLCTIGLNQKTLEEVNYAIFDPSTFANEDECSVDGEPDNSPNRKLALQARFSNYQPVYNQESDSYVCELIDETIIKNNKVIQCYNVHIYATWSYLIPLMKCVYDVDPTQKTFEIKIPINATRLVLNSYSC